METMTKVVLITGVGRREGIGLEVARQLGRQGHVVWITARDRARVEALADELRDEHLRVHTAHLDVTDVATIRAVAQTLEREVGRLDVLVNNAAATGLGERATTSDLSRARAAMDATLFGAWHTTQVLLPLLLRSEHPRIVNVSSGAGSHGDPVFGLDSPSPMGAGYAVAKTALNALTSRLANELRNEGVLVNAVCPGFTATFRGGREMGARPVPEGAAGVVWAALLPDDGPTGGFFRDEKPLPW